MADTSNHLKPLDWPPIHVDVRVNEDQLGAMLNRVEQNFTFLGEEDPHWSVLTSEKFRRDQIGENADEFFRSGKQPVDNFVATLARNGLAIPSGGRCLELGCGLARSSIWLAPLFSELVAVDISAPHLRLAEAVAREFAHPNISFTHLGQIRTLSSLGEFDYFFSIIVLQHNPPPVIHEMLRRIFLSMRPGGIVYFQVPTYRLGYRFDAEAYLATENRIGHPEMHVVPQHVIHSLFREVGLELIEIREDGAAGGDNISSRMLARRAA